MYKSALSHCSPSSPSFGSGLNSLRMYFVSGEERISQALISNGKSVKSISMYICVTAGTSQVIKLYPGPTKFFGTCKESLV